MFAILMKDVDGRKSYRYFKEWGNAERAMMEDVCAVKKLVGITKEEHIDTFNSSKGIYEREEILVGCCGTRFHYALLGGYFED